MASVLARAGPSADWTEHPPSQMSLALPVLYDGHRPRKSRRRKPRRRQEGAKAPVQLDFHDLFEQLLVEEKLAEQAARELNAIDGEPDAEPWSEEEVYRLHTFLLERSLEVLADTRTSAATVMEILDWMNETPAQRAKGISFVTCCEIHGYDAEELREQVRYEVGRLHGVWAAQAFID